MELNFDVFSQTETYIPLAKSIATALAVVVIGWIASKWAHRLSLKALGSRKIDESLSRFLANIVQYVVIAAAAVSALGAVGIETASVIAMLASAGLAVGLALQGNLANFASGVMILLFRPFQLNDKVTVAGQTGVVEDIGLFATTMGTPDNITIIVPNSQITGGVITNITRKGTVRGDIGIGVAYGTNLAAAEAVLLTAAQGSKYALSDPGASVALTGFGASSVDFTVMTWSTTGDYLDMLNDVRHRIYDGLNAAGIDIPFDQVVMHTAPAEAQE